MTATTPRVLRADAERNLRRVLDAALEVFAEHGIDAPVTLIAERAGVGVATIFRRFPTKDDLLAALLAHRGEQLVAAADAALERDDPEAAFRELAELITATQIADRGFCDAIGTELFRPGGPAASSSTASAAGSSSCSRAPRRAAPSGPT